MSVLSDLALFVGVLTAWSVAMYFFSRTQAFQRWNLGLSLFILMVRTVRGREMLDRVAQRRRFWRGFGELSIGLVLIAMAGITALLAWEATIVWQLDLSQAPRAELLLGIPGLNPVIPLGYGIFGLAIAIVLHEFAHGILSCVSNVKIQSLGLLFVIFPIGAFVEPDEAQMRAMPRRERMRLYAVGPATNLLLAGIFFLSFSLLLMPAAVPYHQGAGLTYVEDAGPAGMAGISEGWIVTSINNTTVSGKADLQRALRATEANRTNVPVTACYREACWNLTVNLSWNRDLGTGETYGRLGVLGSDTTDVYSPLGADGDPGRGALLFIALPVAGTQEPGLMPVGYPRTEFYRISGPWAALPPELFWVLVSGSYFLFWLNLMLGATNALPAVPLDGGYLFRDGLHGLLQRLRPAMPEERREKGVRWTSYAVSLIILALIVWQFAGPYVKAWLTN